VIRDEHARKSKFMQKLKNSGLLNQIPQQSA